VVSDHSHSVIAASEIQFLSPIGMLLANCLKGSVAQLLLK